MKTWIVIIALAAVPAFADDVYLRGGGQITGEIVEETDDYVKVDIGGGTITAKRSSIVGIEESVSPLQEYRLRAAEIPNGDVEAWRELARWASNRTLSSQAWKAYSEVLRILPDDPESNKALGRVKLDGKWVTEEESYEAQGYIKFEGEWMTPQERGSILAERRAQEQADRQANEAAIQAIEAEERAERDRQKVEREESERQNSVHWGWGTGPRYWPVPSEPPPTNPVDRQTGDWQ